MKKYLIALLLVTLFTVPAFANKITEETNDFIEDEENINAFGFPDKNVIKIIENKINNKPAKILEKPECSDKILAKMARDAAEPFINIPSISIFNKRRNLLITKNIDNFTDLSIGDIPNMQNKIILARMTELKINNNLRNENFKICQSDNPILNDKLFVLMYDNNDNIKVELLNLAIENIPSFYFYDK